MYLTKPLNHESVYLQPEFCSLSCFTKPFDIIELNFKRLEITKKVTIKVYSPGNRYAISNVHNPNDIFVFQLCTNLQFLLFASHTESIYVWALKIDP